MRTRPLGVTLLIDRCEADTEGPPIAAGSGLGCVTVVQVKRGAAGPANGYWQVRPRAFAMSPLLLGDVATVPSKDVDPGSHNVTRFEGVSNFGGSGHLW